VLVDLVDQFLVDIGEFEVELLDLLVEADQRLLVGELGVEVCNGVEVGLLELFAHGVILALHYNSNQLSEVEYKTKESLRAGYRGGLGFYGLV
jgi:hypothetical protein